MTDQRLSIAIPRDSHDLSLSPRNVTRDSFVTNMLLSLDQFSIGQSDSQDGTDSFERSTQSFESSSAWADLVSRTTSISKPSKQGTGARVVRNGHNPRNSIGSEHAISQIPAASSSRHRSSSSSSFQSLQKDLDSGSAAINQSQGQVPAPRRKHKQEQYQHHHQLQHHQFSRRATGSQSSDTTESLDLPYTAAAAAAAAGKNKLRSTESFDQERPSRDLMPVAPAPPPVQLHMQQQRIMQRRHHQQQAQQPSDDTLASANSYHNLDYLSRPYEDEDLDTAPTPTIHSGPRRMPSTPAMSRSQPGIGIGTDPSHSTDARGFETRKRSGSSRSLKTTSNNRKNNATHDGFPAVPSMSLPKADNNGDAQYQDAAGAPAPHVGYRKTKPDAAQVRPDSPSIRNNAPLPKERSGFFRKIFGSNSPKPSTEQDPPINYRLPQSGEHRGVRSTGSRTRLADANPSAPSTASRDTSSPQPGLPTLQKKPSSFFRRRRKSVNDEQPAPEEPPPLPTVNLAHNREHAAGGVALPSPVTSLREAMNPYIHTYGAPAAVSTPVKHANALADVTNTTPSSGRTDDSAREYKREFSPDYEPSPNARIRTVRPDTVQKAVTNSQNSHGSPALNTRNSDLGRDGSFLDLDMGSDNDGEGGVAISQETMPSSRSDERVPHKGKTEDKDATIRAQHAPKSTTRTAPDDAPEAEVSFQRTRAGSIASVSTGTDYKSAMSNPPTPSVYVEGASEKGPTTHRKSRKQDTAKTTLDEPEVVIGDPTEDDRLKASKIFEGSEDFIQRGKAAAWIGEEGSVRKRTLQAYMELYDFSGCSILHSLRQICSRLILKAETQQVDRILAAFAHRWRDCNPNHGFKATDAIHTICYSIMLLNTDLHLADIEQKMTRSQFVKNTLSTITQAVLDSYPEAFSRRPSILPGRDLQLGPQSLARQSQDRKAAPMRPPPRTEAMASGSAGDIHDCGPLVNAPFTGTLKAWEEQVEIVLKRIYNSIREDRLPLFGAEPEKHLNSVPSQSSLSVAGMLRRSPSVLSKAPSDSQTSSRGRIHDHGRNLTASRWSSKSRSRPGLVRNGFSSSRTSFDDGQSVWSPTLSSANWSRQSLGRTQTSVSQDSLGSAMPRGDYQQSIGFANALSQAITRNEELLGDDVAASVMSVDISNTHLLEDESLELAGPPWVKEGMVIHKHHLEGVDKKARERNWSEVFAVIQKGQVSLFSFQANKTARQKSRTREARKVRGPVGGGNWQDNATMVGHFSLRQTLASALPPPGYSRNRPHVWALSLPSGAVHLFQVGTPELIKEFVNTVNYWSARLSTHPLVGGVSNVEYGWSSSVVNSALVSATNENATAGRQSRPSSSMGRRSSIASANFRSSSFDHGLGAALTNNTGRGKLPGDRINISEWGPPAQSLRPSCLPEIEQLATLKGYVQSIETELQSHNQLRSSMLLAFTPRGTNASKAMANWERKSAYLLREIVKFRTYVDCLQAAESRKHEIYSERDLARRAASGDLSDDEVAGSDDEEADETLRP